MIEKKVPKATLQRYPIYLKALRKLKEDGRDKVMSSELAEILSIEPTTIRRDFSYFGSLGRQGYGYDVDKLIHIFSDGLGMNYDEKIILVGAGNLGKALLNYNQWNHVVGKIICAFDLKPEKVEAPVPVYHLNELKEKMPEGCRIAILCISHDVQETVDLLVDCGIKGFVNFAMEHFSVPSGVVVKNVDVVSLIQELVVSTTQETDKEQDYAE